ncbi:MAG TPA: divergent polysaccharide deacetylase family protein [Rhizomicrobium sp.]|nr:divergent polysaccharide deacetylase family protein [Rhizomicrobium sp.]
MAAKRLTGAGAENPARRGPNLLAISYLTLFVVLIAGAAAVTFLGDSHAGDPVVTLELAKAPAIVRKPFNARSSARQPTEQGAQMGASVPPPGKITQKLYAGRALVADPALIENSPQGPLPRIADDGSAPLRAYAPGFVDDGRPRIAIVISGLGISAKATAAALKELPAGVTLAVAPYGADAQRWVNEARAQGHEVLLEVPMEPYDFPDSDPGPYTLRSGVDEDANAERLAWALTRFTGYVGVTNLLGDRFLADPASLEPALVFLARRGLMFYDNGAASHSAAPDVAARAGIAFAQADTTIDTIQTAMEIDRRLSALEETAHARGSAAGSGFIYPITLDRVSRWAESLSSRGFVLAPASAIVAQPKSP